MHAIGLVEEDDSSMRIKWMMVLLLVRSAARLRVGKVMPATAVFK